MTLTQTGPHINKFKLATKILETKKGRPRDSIVFIS